MTIVKSYDLVGKYSKLFDAKRGKYFRARSRAIFEISIDVPTFSSWQYFAGPRILKVTYTQAPTYLVEDALFDIFEKHINNVA